jgi:hypothetical protein
MEDVVVGDEDHRRKTAFRWKVGPQPVVVDPEVKVI